MVSPKEALLQEFSTHYLVDEMPRFSREFSENVLPRWAKATALRLSGQVRDIGNLIRLMDELGNNPIHPTLAELEDVTSIDWTDEWPTFTRLLEMIVESLRKIAAGDRVSLGIVVYRHTEGTETTYRLCDEDTGTELLLVHDPEVSGRILTVRFESSDPKLGVSRASTLIAKHVLHDFLVDRYQGNVDIVEYADAARGDIMRLQYPSLG